MRLPKREWFVLAISLAFVTCGLFLIPRRPDVAVPTLALFGVCAAVAGATILRKRRFRALRPTSVEVVGGVPLRPLRARITLLALTLTSLGSVLLVYWRATPIFIVVCAAVIFVSGVVLLLGLALGRLPVGFLQFDPEGLTIGERGHSFLVPWDAISAVAPGEFHDNPVLCLWIGNMSQLVMQPAAARSRVLARLASNQAWVGCHVMVITSHYGIDLPLLVVAIEGYIKDETARERLRLPRLKASPNV